MHLHEILEVELIDVWRIDFMSFSFLQIRISTYTCSSRFVSKWVETLTFPTSDAKVVIKLLKKNIFTKFETPRAIISDKGSHFCNEAFETFLASMR